MLFPGSRVGKGESVIARDKHRSVQKKFKDQQPKVLNTGIKYIFKNQSIDFLNILLWRGLSTYKEF
jgi:hypothetical protein